jgi:hypothetical protein
MKWVTDFFHGWEDIFLFPKLKIVTVIKEQDLFLTSNLANKGGIITGAGNRIETDLSEKVP